MRTENRNSEVEVSIYKNFKHIKNSNILDVLRAIKNGIWEKEISQIRELIKEDNKEWEDVKQNLYAFTPSATFSQGRKMEFLKNYNQMIILDIDDVEINVESPTRLIDIANNDRHVFASFISPSYTGFKLIIKVDSQLEQHETAFFQLVQHFESLLGVHIDACGKDFTRLCFISADERTYINEDAAVFMVNTDEVYIDEAIRRKPLTNPETDLAKLEERFKKAVEFTYNKKPFHEGNRNNSVHLLANNLNRWGFPEEYAISKILAEFPFDSEKKIVGTVKSAFNNRHQHNTFPLEKESIVALDALVAPVAQQNPLIKSFNQLALAGKTLKPLKKIFGNFILEKSTTLFPSERGIGKSMLAMQLAIKIAAGDNEFLGEAIEINGNVLYVNHEMGDHMLSKRMEVLMSPISWNSKFTADCLTSWSGIKAIYPDIINYCKEKKPVLVIIDNLRTAFSGSDNEKNKEMTTMITFLKELRDEVGTAFLLVHHFKKGTSNQETNSDMQSGAGALTDLVDADFFLRRSHVNSQYRILKRLKARNCEEQEGAKLISLDPETLWFEFIEDGVNETEHVIYENSKPNLKERRETAFGLMKKGMTDAEIARQLGVNRSNVGRWRRSLE